MTRPKTLMALVIVTVAMTNGCILNCAFRRASCDGPACGPGVVSTAGYREERVGLSKHLHDSLTCQSGCGGDLYMGDWASNPPDAHDPCDECGNWVGGGSGTGAAAARMGIPPFIARSFGNIWGRRYHSCGHPACSDCGGVGIEAGEAIEYHQPHPEPAVAEKSVLRVGYEAPVESKGKQIDIPLLSSRRLQRTQHTGRTH